ncbi:hypothetical protein CC2G_009827 [Coprinopsis cinerea AmutBmut pab1-1]|nr:hypothetical protein CC2G_009827 [Coprinopsis cinerea AmutBmut pab1-1]
MCFFGDVWDGARGLGGQLLLLILGLMHLAWYAAQIASFVIGTRLSKDTDPKMEKAGKACIVCVCLFHLILFSSLKLKHIWKVYGCVTITSLPLILYLRAESVQGVRDAKGSVLTFCAIFISWAFAPFAVISFLLVVLIAALPKLIGARVKEIGNRFVAFIIALGPKPVVLMYGDEECKSNNV